MINRSLLVGIVLFTIYSLVINLKPKLSSTQHQWQDNIAKAQNYVFNESDTLNNIIIGSSLSCRILTDSLPSFYNLSFNGQGIFDGLKIIKNKHNLPKNIFIETNVILRKENSDFTSSLLFPISFYLRKHLLSLRADKQPISILLRYLKIKNHQPNEIKNNIKLSTKSNEFYKNISKIKTTENLNFRNGNTFDNMFKMQITEYSKQPNKETLNEQLLLLTEYVKYMKSNGVRVCFFEMPVNNKLMELPKARTIRNEIYKHFPKNEYDYILPDSSEYVTTDGCHLNTIESIKYTTYFRTQLKKHKFF